MGPKSGTCRRLLQRLGTLPWRGCAVGADDSAFADAAAFAPAQLAAPYRPGQVFCTGANYKKHVVGPDHGRPLDAHRRAREPLARRAQARVEAMMDQRAKALPFCSSSCPRAWSARATRWSCRATSRSPTGSWSSASSSASARITSRAAGDGPCRRLCGGQRRHRARAHLPPRRLGDRRRLAVGQMLPDLPAVRADDRAAARCPTPTTCNIRFGQRQGLPGREHLAT